MQQYFSLTHRPTITREDVERVARQLGCCLDSSDVRGHHLHTDRNDIDGQEADKIQAEIAERLGRLAHARPGGRERA